MLNKFSPLDFNYLLLEYYKMLNISDDELLVLLMADHLINDGNKMLTNELLELKLNLSFARIDQAFSSLLTKKFIIFETIDNEFVASLKNIKSILVDCYKKDLNMEDYNSKDAELDNLNENKIMVLSSFEKYFQRSLSPLEINLVNKWIDDGVSIDMIIDSLKDAYNLGILTFKKIDSIIASKIKEEEND